MGSALKPSSKSIIKAAESLGLRVHPDYSGRCMFGKLCLGVSGPYESLDDLLSQVRNSSKGLCKDSLGLGGIYYWPDLTGISYDSDESVESAE